MGSRGEEMWVPELGDREMVGRRGEEREGASDSLQQLLTGTNQTLRNQGWFSYITQVCGTPCHRRKTL